MKSGTKRAIFLLAAALVACDSESPGSQPTPPLVTDAGALPASPHRTVGHRNPFGDAFQADNLMVDGDFELTGRNDQAPWIAYSDSQGQVTLDYDTGGRCRSGVRCGVLYAGQNLVGWMGSPMLTKMEIKAYAKVDSGNCSDVTILPVDIGTGFTTKYVSAVSKTPAADGWCVYEGESDNFALAQPALFVSLGKNAKRALVDQVSVLPAGESAVHGIPSAPGPVDAATKARVGRLAGWVRTHRKYGSGRRPERP